MDRDPILEINLQDGVLRLAGALVAGTVSQAERSCATLPRQKLRAVDGAKLAGLDTAGAVFVKRLGADGAELQGFREEFQRLLALLPAEGAGEGSVPPEAARDASLLQRLESLGDTALRGAARVQEVAILVSEMLWWSLVGLVDRSQYRRGSFTEQAFLMGSSALPIVATIMFLVGAISVLQSASTLRAFGANVFVVDMLAIGFARELAPLLTAIVVSGRSGSAIASEVATMKFTEELDALKTMGLNPLRFVAVPKLWAMVVGLPLLSIMALASGILGGFVVATSYMDLPANTFIQRLLDSLLAWDLITGLIKSVSFAIIISVIGVYRGLHFSGGADGVGRATTASVVTSIFAMIVVDSIWGLIFYL